MYFFELTKKKTHKQFIFIFPIFLFFPFFNFLFKLKSWKVPQPDWNMSSRAIRRVSSAGIPDGFSGSMDKWRRNE